MKNPISLAVLTLLLPLSSLPAATLYVSLESTNPTPPYASWDTAATNIQQAVGTAAGGDQVVVTNGVYPGYVGVNNPLTLLSVNGPEFTIINGGGTNHCAFLTHGASLSGFTLTNGRSPIGGGVYCPSADSFLTNCVIAGNSSFVIVNTAAEWRVALSTTAPSLITRSAFRAREATEAGVWQHPLQLHSKCELG